MIDKHTRQNPLFQQYEQWRRRASEEVMLERGKAAELSRALGVSRQAISRWMNGQTPIPAWAAIALRQWLRAHPTQKTLVRLGSDN